MAEDRKALHAYLEPETHAIWQSLADENGVSVTGLLEGLGQRLGEEAEAAGNDFTAIQEDLVRRARQVDARRRRRGA